MKVIKKMYLVNRSIMRLTKPLWDIMSIKKWKAVIGEVLEAKMEPTNEIDKYTMAACNEGDIVDHLPK